MQPARLNSVQHEERVEWICGYQTRTNTAPHLYFQSQAYSLCIYHATAPAPALGPLKLSYLN